MIKDVLLATGGCWLRNLTLAFVAFVPFVAIQNSARAANATDNGVHENGTLTGQLAYEGFNYSAGASLAGQGGGFGWSNVWMDVSGSSGETVISGLAAGQNAPRNFDNRSAGNAAYISNASRSGRWLDCSPTGNFGQAGVLDANGNIGANGKTIYVSFLQKPNLATNNFYEFEFHRNDLGDPGRIGGIGCDVPNSTQVYLRAPATTQTPMGLADTNINFYVLRIDYKAGNDDVTVYRNPTSDIESNNDPVLTLLGAADMSFDGISMAAYLNGATVADDEIRIGTTWASVLGNPPIMVTQPASQNAYAGQSVALVTLTESSQPLSYQWYRVSGGATNSLPAETNTDLSFGSIQPGDSGEYFITASNALGWVVSPMAILAVKPISLALSNSLSLSLSPGSNTVIAASVNGFSPLTLQWYRDGAAIVDATNAALQLTNGMFDAGRYVLVADNSFGSVTSSVVSAFPNFGGLLAYEGFNYGNSSSDIGGAAGGFGWGGAWVNVNGAFSQSFSNSLAASTSGPEAYDAHSLPGRLLLASGSRKGRYLDCSPTGSFAQRGYLDGYGNVGADGTTLYLSFLQQPNSTSQFYEFELKRDDLGDGGRLGGIGNDTGDSHAHLRIESPPGGSSTFYDLGPGSTNVNFYVLRIDYHPGNDTVSVYRNPTSASEPATPTVTVSNVPDVSFDGVSLAAYLNGVTVAHDEVRVGTTWGDVVGQTVSQLKLAQWKNNSSNVRIAGSPNYPFEILAATNVMGPWSNIGAVTIPSTGATQFVDTNSTNLQRFYRALNGMTASMPSSADVVIADFEQSGYGNWLVAGTAFGSGPAQGTLPNQNSVSGYQGSGLVNSYYGTDVSTGTLTSPPFIISKPYLNFLIGGGNIPGQECMNLVVSNVVVRTATGANSESLAATQWDLNAYLGQTATLQIIDSATGGWGHILIDQITLSDTAFPPAPSLSRTMLITNSLLNLPVGNSSPTKRVTISVGGNPVRDFNIKLADGAPDWWAFVDVSQFQGQTATISVNNLSSGSTGLTSVMQSNGIAGSTNLYRETLRPQFHFSTKRGWLNDANGMFFDHGLYHLYYQHDPFTWDGSGQKWWGHAVSADMVNWRELPEGIYSHAYGDDVWSGSAVVDAANTSGFKTGTNDVIVAAFYSTARGECIAYSNDRGLTFTDYTNNPVVVHSGTGRDPHMFWYAPSNYWVMALYDDSGGNGIQFYTTPDFRHWTFRSKILNSFFECPDMFQLPVDGNTNNTMWMLSDASSGYQLGQFNGATFTPSTSKLPGNSGAGFYAAQTFTSMPPGDHRTVRMGWAQISTPGMPFNELLYFPTELSLRTTANGPRLCSVPVAEITNNAVTTYAWTNLSLGPGFNPLWGIRGALFDVKAQFTAGTAQAINFAFQGVTVTYNPATQQISCNGISNSLPPSNGSVQLEIVVDRDSIEIFGNGGLLYMPMPASNPVGNSLISLTSTGGTANFGSLTVSKLKSIWP